MGALDTKHSEKGIPVEAAWWEGPESRQEDAGILREGRPGVGSRA